MTFGELSVVRSFGRLLIPLSGIGLILWMLYAGTVWMERILTKKEDVVENIPTAASFIDADGELKLPDDEFVFPYRAELESADGRKVDALLLGRPSNKEIIFQRTSDDRVFSLELKRLSSDSQLFLSEFPTPNRSAPENELFRMIFPEKSILESGLEFPHDCTLVSKEGRTLPVTLLERPSPSDITLRRKLDGKVFTIPLSRLIESDRDFIRLFNVGDGTGSPFPGYH